MGGCLFVPSFLKHCYCKALGGGQYWNPQSLSYQFLAEARRLWEIETAKPTLTTLQAAIVLYFLYSYFAQDQIGKPFLVKAMAIAEDMQLFRAGVHHESRDIRIAREYTAWCLFSSQQ